VIVETMVTMVIMVRKVGIVMINNDDSANDDEMMVVLRVIVIVQINNRGH